MEIKIGRPSYIPKRFNACAFLKFYDELKYVDTLRKGNLYMRSREFFATVEKEGMGDGLENKTIVALPTATKKLVIDFIEINRKSYVSLSETDKTGNDDNSVFLLNDNASKKQKIFCLYTLWYDANTGEIYNIDEKMKNEFGEFCCFIYNPKEFLNRVFDGEVIVVNGCSNIYAGFVDYYNISSSVVHEWHPFRKEIEQFGQQNEFRIMVLSEDDNEAINFSVHNNNFKDISVKTTFDNISSGFKIENGIVYIPVIED